ncbi:MAG TPA: hypothetical protein VG815_20190 [Chloroflexota bacterium]|nr:hypothetical protein [Chloroflexota bacterium]
MDRTFGLKLMLVSILAMLIIGRLALHIASSILLPLVILFAVLFFVLLIGARLGLKR